MTQETDIEGRGLAPIPMVLFCPACGLQHVDGPDNNFTGDANWTNPPHRSHACQRCGCIWRPADVATTGVAAVQSKGKADTWDTSRTEMAPISIEVRKREVVEGLNNVLSEKLERRTAALEAAEAKREAVERENERLRANNAGLDGDLRVMAAHANALSDKRLAAEARANSLAAEVERLKAAKWDVKHIDTLNDMVAMGLARDAAVSRANSLEGKLKVAREAMTRVAAALESEAENISPAGGVHPAPFMCQQGRRLRQALSAIDSGES
jgi:hypothetical protein